MKKALFVVAAAAILCGFILQGDETARIKTKDAAAVLKDRLVIPSGAASVDMDVANANVRMTAAGTATATTQGYASNLLSFLGSGWTGTAPLTTSFRISNQTYSSTNYKFSLQQTTTATNPREELAVDQMGRMNLWLDDGTNPGVAKLGVGLVYISSTPSAMVTMGQLDSTNSQTDTLSVYHYKSNALTTDPIGANIVFKAGRVITDVFTNGKETGRIRSFYTDSTANSGIR